MFWPAIYSRLEKSPECGSWLRLPSWKEEKEKSSRNQQSNNSRSFLHQKVGEQQASRQARLPGTEWQRVSPGNGATAKQP
jgi:hypothetical protein